MVPYHVQVYANNGAIFRGFFYKEGGEFLVSVELDDGSMYDGGRWPSIAQADEFARMVVADISGDPAKHNPLTKYRGGGYLLLVTFDQQDGMWAVVAGSRKNGKFEDTKARFNTQEEARRAVDACTS